MGDWTPARQRAGTEDCEALSELPLVEPRKALAYAACALARTQDAHRQPQICRCGGGLAQSPRTSAFRSRRPTQKLAATRAGSWSPSCSSSATSFQGACGRACWCSCFLAVDLSALSHSEHEIRLVLRRTYADMCEEARGVASGGPSAFSGSPLLLAELSSNSPCWRAASSLARSLYLVSAVLPGRERRRLRLRRGWCESAHGPHELTSLFLEVVPSCFGSCLPLLPPAGASRPRRRKRMTGTYKRTLKARNFAHIPPVPLGETSPPCYTLHCAAFPRPYPRSDPRVHRQAHLVHHARALRS